MFEKHGGRENIEEGVQRKGEENIEIQIIGGREIGNGREIDGKREWRQIEDGLKKVGEKEGEQLTRKEQQLEVFFFRIFSQHLLIATPPPPPTHLDKEGFNVSSPSTSYKFKFPIREVLENQFCPSNETSLIRRKGIEFFLLNGNNQIVSF